jgi:tRNA acetyltransferase TAN1
MTDFNMLVSTARDYESQCESELWFNLLALGDPSPKMTRPGIPGLLLVKTSVDVRTFIYHLQSILSSKEPDYIQFIAKIYPIDIVISSELDLMANTALKLIADHSIAKDPTSKYRITIRKRQSSLSTEEIISKVANLIPNPVSLNEYDWNLEIEIINQIAGLSILSKKDIFSPLQEKKPSDLSLENDEID